MEIGGYIRQIEEFLPQLTALGYVIGDFNRTLPVIHVSGNGIETYVPVEDRVQLESLVDPELHADRLAAMEGE